MKRTTQCALLALLGVLIAAPTAMADEEVTGEEGAATIAMPAIDAATKLKFGIPDAATVMDPGGLPNAAWPDRTDRAEVEADEDELEEVDDEYAAPDTATRGYSADELAELQRLLDKKGRR